MAMPRWLSSFPRALASTGRTALALLLLAGAGCAGDGRPPVGRGALEIFTAGALARPLRAAADSFAVAAGVAPPRLEAAGSLETVRKLTELHRIPDLLAVADGALIEELLMPRGAVRWYVLFAADRMVLAYTPRSRGAELVNRANWPAVATDGDVLVGRSDPDRDPAGYRALLAMQLAERHYGTDGLAARLLEHAPPRAMRPKSADLVALLQAGELDYAWLYRSVARTAGLLMVPLPPEVDLGEPDQAEAYASAVVRVAGAAPGDTLEIHGRPILFALTVPVDAPRPGEADRFAAWLLGPAGRRALAGAGVDLLAAPLGRGGELPEAVRDAIGQSTAAPR